MHSYNGVDALPPPPALAKRGLWTTPNVPDDGNDRDAASAGVGIEGVTNRTEWLRHRMMNGLEGGLYFGAQGFAAIVTIKAAHVLDLTVPAGKTVTITGEPNDVFDVQVVCTEAGTVGTAPGPKFKWSKDGGATFTAPAALGAGTTIVITGTGNTVNFATAQGWTAGLTVTYNTTPKGAFATEGPNANDATGALAIFNGPAFFAQDTSFSQAISVGHTSSFAGGIDVAGQVTIGGGLTCSPGSVTQLGDVLYHSGDDAYRVLRKATGVNGDWTFQPWKADLWIAPKITVTSRVWTLDPPPNDDVIEFTIFQPDNSGGISLAIYSDGVAIAEFGTGHLRCATFIYDGVSRYRVKSSEPA